MVSKIDIHGTTFRDGAGRHIILHRPNFEAEYQVPYTPAGRNGPASIFRIIVPSASSDGPLEELDCHFSQITHWGFNSLPSLIAWEEVEHAAPGEHNEAYLHYFAEFRRRVGCHGLHRFFDAHQDAWSSIIGGDGARGSTIDVAGIDFTKLGCSGAAHLMQYRYDPAVGERQHSYAVMSWSGYFMNEAHG